MQRLRKILRQRGITQRQLAEMSGVAQPSISLIVNGKRSPNWETACQIADALGVSLDDLRDDKDEDQEEEEQCAEVEQMCLCA